MLIGVSAPAVLLSFLDVEAGEGKGKGVGENRIWLLLDCGCI